MAGRPPEDVALSHRVDSLVSGVDATFARWDRSPQASAARRRHVGRTARSVGRRVLTGATAIAALIVATIGFGLVVGPIGITGLFVVALLTLALLVFVAFAPGTPERIAYDDKVPTQKLVHSLESLLVRKRAALPPVAARQVDAISATLPRLESRLAEVDPLDPLAQDARRLMGKHLPELIDRFERVPAADRAERDGAGLTMEERLATSLEAARTALDEIGARLVRSDREAFETQGRFIESRYKDPGGLSGQ